MGIFNSIKSLGSAAVKTAVVPVSVAADIITIGGLLTDKNEPYTSKNLKSIKESLSNSYNEIIDD